MRWTTASRARETPMEARASMSGWVDGGRRGSVIGKAEVE